MHQLPPCLDPLGWESRCSAARRDTHFIHLVGVVAGDTIATLWETDDSPYGVERCMDGSL